MKKNINSMITRVNMSSTRAIFTAVFHSRKASKNEIDISRNISSIFIDVVLRGPSYKIQESWKYVQIKTNLKFVFILTLTSRHHAKYEQEEEYLYPYFDSSGQKYSP